MKATRAMGMAAALFNLSLAAGPGYMEVADGVDSGIWY
jgi:hypothetical protein